MAAEGYEVGQDVWLPCMVANGALPMERFVRVGSHWAGMVSVTMLWNTATIVGGNRVRVSVTERTGTGVRFRITGQPVASRFGWEFVLPHDELHERAVRA